MKNIFLYAIALGFSFFQLNAQTQCNFTLRGKILDENRNPLVGATAYITKINIGEVCNNEGEFQFTELCSGEYELEFKYVGYQNKTLKFTVPRSGMIEIILEPEERILGEVVVTGHQEPVSKSSNYQALTGNLLEATRGKSLGEALQNVTGVNTIQSGPAIFKPMIHGVHSQRILILNNGVRQEGQQWGAEHAPEIDPFVASNIVVVKDAAAIKYGTDALGGVIIVNPAELPSDQKIGGSLHLIGASNGRAGVVSALLEGGLGKHTGWGWRAQSTVKQYGDLHAADYNLSNTGFKEFNYSLSAGYHKANKGFEFFYSRFNTTIGILRGSVVGSAEDLANALETEPPQFTESFTYKISEPRQEVTHDLLKLTGHLRKGKDLYNVQYGIQINNRKEFDVRRGSLKDIPALGYILYTQTLDADWERTISDSHKRSLGINGMWQDNNKIDGTQTIPFIPNFTNLSGGIYWIERMSIRRWDAEAGARYDYRYYDIVGFDFANQLYRTDFSFNNASGTIAATYRISDNSSFTSSAGSTWRPPSVAELYSLGTHQSTASIEYGLLLDEITNEVKEISNSNFKIERALKWVNTYRYKKERLNAELVGYINYIYNYTYLKPRGVTQNPRGIFPYFRYTQTDASFVGADFLMTYDITRSFSTNMRASLLRATDVTNDDYLIFIPSNRYEISFREQLPKIGSWNNFFAEVKIKYVAMQNRAPRVVPISDIIEAKEQGIDLFENDNRNFDFVEAPQAYFLTTASAGISKNISRSLFEIRLTADNITNTAYREYSNRMRYYADDLGRNFSLTLKCSF